MTAFAFALAALFSILPWLVSRYFQPRFAGYERVVMNWSFDGKPNSYASPRVALSVTPVIGTVVLLLLAGMVAFATPAEDRMSAIAVIPFTALVFAGIHAGHLHFAARAASSEDSRR